MLKVYRIGLDGNIDPNVLGISSVDYQIAIEPDFTDDSLIIDIENDDQHLTGRDFPLDFTISEVFYGRMRVNYNDGTDSGWLAPVVIYQDTDDISDNQSFILTPELRVDGDLESMRLGGFKLYGSKYTILFGNYNHKYTHWYIKELDSNKVIWKREYDKENLTEIRVPELILKPNSSYRIEAIYEAKNGLRSNTGALIITTREKLTPEERIAMSRANLIVDDKVHNYYELEEAYEELLTELMNVYIFKKCDIETN